MYASSRFIALLCVLALTACQGEVANEELFFATGVRTPEGSLRLEVVPLPNADLAVDEPFEDDLVAPASFEVALFVGDEEGTETEHYATISQDAAQAADPQIRALIDALANAPGGVRNDLAHHLTLELQNDADAEVRDLVEALMRAALTPVPGLEGIRVDKSVTGFTFAPAPSQTTMPCAGACQSELSARASASFSTACGQQASYTYCGSSNTCVTSVTYGSCETPSYAPTPSAGMTRAERRAWRQRQRGFYCDVPVITYQFDPGGAYDSGCYAQHYSEYAIWNDPLGWHQYGSGI